MGTNLKLVCDMALKIVLQSNKIYNIDWGDRERKKSEIKDLRKLIVTQWCNEISSLAPKC